MCEFSLDRDNCMSVLEQVNKSCLISSLENLNKLKEERDQERANDAFASLDSDESGRYYALYCTVT